MQGSPGAGRCPSLLGDGVRRGEGAPCPRRAVGTVGTVGGAALMEGLRGAPRRGGSAGKWWLRAGGGACPSPPPALGVGLGKGGALR